MDRSTKFAICSVFEALNEANLNINSNNERRIAIIVSTVLGGIPEALHYYDRFKTYGIKRANPYFTIFTTDIAASHIAVNFEIKGPAFSVSCGCSSGAAALSIAFDLINSESIDAVIVCGTETPINKAVIAPLYMSKVLSTDFEEPQLISRPFDIKHNGFVISEGAGTIILESKRSFLTHSCNPYAYLLGYGCSTDTFSVNYSSKTPQEMINSMNMALKNSKVKPHEVDYINAYANSCSHSDNLEANAISSIFDNKNCHLLVNSTKSLIGHSLGASSIIETIATLLELKHDFIHPNLNYNNPDPNGNINKFIAKNTIQKNINIALKNSFSFGNRNYSLVFKKFN
jgi:3-oxoacyl-[acyl-carrier-protein] synthase II